MPRSQRAFVERLAAHDLAGLGLGTGFAHPEAPGELRAAAEELGFPLVEVPYETPFIAITEKAFSHLVNEQYAILQRALSAHERLEQIVLSEQGLEGVAAALAGLIGGTAIVFDARGEPLARSDGAVPLVGRRAGRDGGGGARARPGRRPARVRAVGRAARPRARPAGGARARARAATTARRRRRGSSPSRTAAGWPSSTGSCCTRPSPSSRSSCCAGASRAIPSAGSPATSSRRWSPASSPGPSWRGGSSRSGCATASACSWSARRARSAGLVEDGLIAALRDEVRGGLTAATGGFFCALLPLGRGESDDELFALAERIRARVSKAAGMALAAGAGRAVPAADLRRAFHEARCALEAQALSGARRQRRAAAAAGHLSRPRLLPAPALAPGRRRAAPLLRLDPRADRGGRGRVRRRADALARDLHRVQRAVGARRAAALLPPAHAALPDPARRGADRALAGLGARPDRLLAGAPRARARPTEARRNP